MSELRDTLKGCHPMSASLAILCSHWNAVYLICFRSQWSFISVLLRASYGFSHLNQFVLNEQTVLLCDIWSEISRREMTSIHICSQQKELLKDLYNVCAKVKQKISLNTGQILSMHYNLKKRRKKKQPLDRNITRRTFGKCFSSVFCWPGFPCSLTSVICVI